MKLVKSVDIENYVKGNKKEAEKEFPNIVKKLLENTVDGIIDLDIPVGDNISQPGFDGRITFKGNNKYLGNKPCKIEIGTNEEYKNKADKDIKKRKPNSRENYIFFTPYRWNRSRPSKDEWIQENKKKYGWNDIKVIDASTLENWLEEDLITSKYILSKLNIISDENDIHSIKEKENEYINKTKKGIHLDFFNYDDEEYEKLLSQLNKEYYNIVAPTREEGLYVTLYYLDKLNKEGVLIIENEETWKKIISKNCAKNGILIPNFYHTEGLEIPADNTTILIYDIDEFIDKCDYTIKQRTTVSLRNALEYYYKDDNGQPENEQINLLIEKSLGKYMTLKRELFKTPIKPLWYNEKNEELFLYLFFINSFKTKDIKIFEDFDIDIKDLKRTLKQMAKEKDPYIVYYKYWDVYKVVNIYNAIEWIGEFIDEDFIEKLYNVVKKVLFYLEPKYLPENIGKTFYIEDTSSRQYSKEIKEGVLKGIVITKLYLKNEHKENLIQKLDTLIDEYYSSISSEGQFLSFANIADKLVEFDYDKYLKMIQHSIGKNEFEKMFDLRGKNSIFSSYEYSNVIMGIEKALNKRYYIPEALETLAQLSEMKNAYYENMVTKPLNTLKKFFLGWDNLTCLELDEKIMLLKKLIKNHKKISKNILKIVFPNGNVSWTPLCKPEFDSYDEPKKIKYVSEQVAYFEKYYELYINNYAEKLEDLVCIYDEVYFIDFACCEPIKNKTLELIKKSNDEDKYTLKTVISGRLRGYKHFHNSAWNLTNKQLNYLQDIEKQIIYENSIYEYIYTYKYHAFLSDENLKKERLKALSLAKNNEENENILLEKCDNRVSLVCDIYIYNHNKKYNIKFLQKLFNRKSNDSENCIKAYLREVYLNESSAAMIEIYNSDEMKQIPNEKRILILSNAGYNDKLYEEIKGTENEALYWQKLNIYEGEKNEFVYESCLNYGNYEMCLEMISESEDEYEKKCLLLEKMRDTKYQPSIFGEHNIKEIFQSFYKYTKITTLERLAKLEMYYSLILDNSTYFLSKEASQTPSVVAELAELAYKDDAGNFFEVDDIETIAYNCYSKLHNLRINFDNVNGIDWCEEFINIMKEKKRSKIMYTVLGQLLARTGNDPEDGMYPSKSVREIIEHFKSEQLARSFEIEKYNARGIHSIGIGEEEKKLSEKYFAWSKKMQPKYTETAKILKSLAEKYEIESEVLREEANYV